MFENIGSFFKKIMKNETKELVSDTTAANASKDAAKERLHLVLMQDRANVSADFLELMKQEIVDVIKKYIVVEEDTIDVRIINQENEDGTNGAPSLCANIPILNIRNDNKGEKFRNGASVTKDIASDDKIEETSNDSSNDNVEIENDSVNEIETNNNLENKVESETEIIEENSNVFEELNNENVDIIETEEINDNNDVFEEIESLENVVNEDVDINSDLDNYEEDEDDDDVTFDDLLKAAEEEEKMQKQSKGTTNKSNSKSKNNKSSKNSNKRKKNK